MKKLIRNNLVEDFLRERPEIYQLLHGLTTLFEVQWAAERVSHNTKMVCVILKPSDEMSVMFGFDREIGFFISRYSEVQARTFQAIDQFCHESPLHERIDPSVVFLNSPDQNLIESIAKQQSEYPQSRMVLGIADQILNQSIEDKWSLKNNFQKTLFVRDLFNYKLPVQPGQFFYGREQIVAALADSVRKGQNSGLFGLRKTGKTSVLLRVRKILESDPSVYTIFLDCKKRWIRKLDCDGLIRKIVEELDQVNSTNLVTKISSDLDATEVLELSIKNLGNKKRLCLIFDEIEYVSPLSPTNPQWTEGFIDFWQAIWSIQSETQKVCFVVCGVNPTVCEEDRFVVESYGNKSIQNPMFGIVDIQYLTGFDFDSLKRMLKFFGARMGLIFSDDAIEYVFSRFGGHPLLSRLACSFYHETFLSNSQPRPVTISKLLEQRMEIECDAEISSYCEHVVSEVREFYPHEFELLSLAARHESEIFYEKARPGRSISHIKNYGLMDKNSKSAPRLLIPALEDYLQRDYLIQTGKEFYRDVIEKEQRETWLNRKKKSLEDDLSIFNGEVREMEGFDLFPGDSPRKIGDFLRCSIVTSEESLTSFLVISHRIFVENIEKHLKKGGRTFSKDLGDSFPQLYEALLRLKLYRHKASHADLDDGWQRRYDKFVTNDFGPEGERRKSEEPFLVQQIILEEMHVALQYEIAKY